MEEQTSPAAAGEARRRATEAGAPAVALDDLPSLRIFAKVVELESFSEAARRIGVTPATVSKHIAALEGQVGARLLNRTTRKLFVTDAGSMLYARTVRVIDELLQAQRELSQLQAEPMGHLRVALPISFGGRRIGPSLPEFMRRFPKVTLELNLSVERLDVFEEQIDVAVRIADAIDPGLVAIRLAPYRRVFCASPEYLARRGTPTTPESLVDHDCLFSRGAAGPVAWPMMQDGRIRQVPVSARLLANHGDPVKDAGLAGLGIFMTARWMVETELRQGRLVEILPECAVQNRAIWAVLSQRGAMTPKVRAFIEFLREVLSDLR